MAAEFVPNWANNMVRNWRTRLSITQEEASDVEIFNAIEKEQPELYDSEEDQTDVMKDALGLI